MYCFNIKLIFINFGKKWFCFEELIFLSINGIVKVVGQLKAEMARAFWTIPQ